MFWVDETRPRNQGGLLTVWELKNEKIPYTLVVDNAGGYLMQNNKIDMCLVGSDRTTVNGDVCNKIGTYLKALSAFENNIPFYVALPTSTIDKKLKEISNIPIEERDKSEISQMNFKYKNKVLNGRIYPGEVKCYNPAFDVTPSKFVSKLITEKGVINANNKRDFKNFKIMEKQIKLDIVKYYKNLLDKGLNIGSEGNLSIKLNDKIFITPSGINIEDLSYKKISEVDINGKILNKIKPSTEIDLHLLIYKKKEIFKQ